MRRFHEMAHELKANESPDALDRAFWKLNSLKKGTPAQAAGLGQMRTLVVACWSALAMAFAPGLIEGAEPVKAPLPKLTVAEVSARAADAFQRSGAAVGRFRAEKPEFYANPKFAPGAVIWLVLYRQTTAPFIPDGNRMVVVNDQTRKACVQQVMTPPRPCE